MSKAVLKASALWCVALWPSIAVGQTRPAVDLIHQGDVIEIDEMGGFEYDWRGGLNPEGFLEGFTKIADPIVARCRSTEDVAEDVRKAYSSTLRSPDVRVRILDRSRRAFAFLDGAIRQPYRLSIRRDVRLSELIVIGGGFTDRAGGEISIFRPEGASCAPPFADDQRALVLKIADILAGLPGTNPSIVSGDIVTVTRVEYVYLVGGINSPGRAAWRAGMTLSRAVASAGGVSNRGVRGLATIFRRNGGATERIEANLDLIGKGDAEDPQLRPRDIIEVPMRGGRRTVAPPVVEDPDQRTEMPQGLPLRVID